MYQDKAYLLGTFYKGFVPFPWLRWSGVKCYPPVRHGEGPKFVENSAERRFEEGLGELWPKERRPRPPTLLEDGTWGGIPFGDVG